MTPANARTYIRYYLWGTVSLVTLFVFINWYFDPYWIWHQQPYIPHEGTIERVLATKQRTTKPLQSFFQRPHTVIMGTSRVYRGMNTDHIDPPQKTYNFGISGLKIKEAYHYIIGLSRWTNTRQIYLGLDLSSFTPPDYVTGFDKSVADYSYPFFATMSSLLSYEALKDSSQIYRKTWGAYSNIELNEHCKSQQGNTYYNGYEYSPRRPACLISYGDQENNKQLPFQFKHFNLTHLNQRLAILQDLIQYTKSKNLHLTLFITPYNKKIDQWYAHHHIEKINQSWKKRIYQMAKENQINLYDFSTENEVTQSLFNSRKSMETNPYFIDSNHMSELVGDYILNCMGFNLKNKIEIPANFCNKVS